MKAVWGAGVVVITIGTGACGRGARPLGDKAPLFSRTAETKTLSSFVVGRWQQSMDYATARSDAGKKAELVTKNVDCRLELRKDGTAFATVAVPLMETKTLTGRWRVNGERVELRFDRTVPAEEEIDQRDSVRQSRKTFEDLVDGFGPLLVDADGRRLRRADVAMREDGSTFIGIPVWLRLSER